MFKLCRLAILPSLKKCFCTLRTASYAFKHLKERALISIVGEETQNYLQGLITNDIFHLSNDCTSQYALFLNSKGRVLYDSIIYRIDYKTYIVECDSSVKNSFEKYLKVFRLKRKVDISFVENFAVYSLFNEDYNADFSKTYDSDKSYPHLNISAVNEILKSKLFKDPRVLELGYRVILNKDDETNFHSQVQDLLQININIRDDISYRKFRYSLGVAEGTTDLPSGNCFPLESNCDYMHGVSFHKGCYIGQELTARTHHTGVVRKRLMPIYLKSSFKEMPGDHSITHEKVKLGKLRGIEGDIGLALLRTDLVSSLQSFKIAGVDAVVKKPFWWPLIASKDNMRLKK